MVLGGRSCPISAGTTRVLLITGGSGASVARRSTMKTATRSVLLVQYGFVWVGASAIELGNQNVSILWYSNQFDNDMIERDLAAVILLHEYEYGELLRQTYFKWASTPRRRNVCLGHYQWRHYRVGDTRGGNWGCHPSIFSWKIWRPFLVASSAVSPVYFLLKNCQPFFAHHCHYHYHFLLLSLGCHVTSSALYAIYSLFIHLLSGPAWCISKLTLLRLISSLMITDAHTFEMLFAPYNRAMSDARSFCCSWAFCYLEHGKNSDQITFHQW